MNLETRVSVARRNFELNVSLDMELAEGEIAVVFGPSGAGKSTFLRSIAGLEPDCKGEIRLNGEVWQTEHSRLFLPPEKRRTGFIFQEDSLFPHLSVSENLDFARTRKRRSDEGRMISFTELIEGMQIEKLLGHYPHQLSGGQKQRVAIVRTLLNEPDLILLDEPVSSLDQEAKAGVLRSLVRCLSRTKVPGIMVTHSMSELTSVSSKMILLSEGRMIGSGPINQLLTHFSLPLIDRTDACSVIEGKTGASDSRYGLVSIEFGPGRIFLPESEMSHASLGESARVRILARDVSIVLEQPVQSSILNVFEGRVLDIRESSPGRVMVTLDCAGQVLLAQITSKSLDQLSLKKSQTVFAQIKCSSFS